MSHPNSLMSKAQRAKQDKENSFMLQDARIYAFARMKQLWRSYLNHTRGKRTVPASICYGQVRGLLYALYVMYGREDLESRLMLRLSFKERTPMHRY